MHDCTHCCDGWWGPLPTQLTQVGKGKFHFQPRLLSFQFSVLTCTNAPKSEKSWSLSPTTLLHHHSSSALFNSRSVVIQSLKVKSLGLTHHSASSFFSSPTVCFPSHSPLHNPVLCEPRTHSRFLPMAELVVAILSPFISPLIEKMASVDVRDFFKRHELDQGQLDKLNVTLNTVAKVVGDAEEKQFDNPQVRAWLDNLKDAAFRADDFLDEVAYEALKLEIESRGAQTSAAAQVRKFLSCFNLCRKGMNIGEMEPRLKEIHQSLEQLVQQMGPLGLEKKNSTGEEKSLPTTSLVYAPDVCGRDGDKKRLVELLRSDDGNGKNVGVVLIDGMGGLGKTTLAQLVYNDDRVQQCFDVRAWVYVPKELEAFCVTRDIMKVVGLGDGIDKMNADQMHCELEKRLSGNKVLLVLDDVWDATQEHWDSLMKPFMSVKQGSKIIVTTRHSSVAEVMSSVSVTIHPLAELSEENSWLLFAKHAFDGKICHEHPDLEKIGREMVQKCNGLPLAAKALGGVLRNERCVGRWKNILNSNMWDLRNNKILPALRLSYSYLPSSLKQCFAYCAIFPKNYEFTKEELVLLWIAEDFIATSGREESMEIGERYFEDLVSRSFLQQQSTTNFDGETVFTMHDLMNDLATLVSREFCSRVEGLDLLKASQRTRYASCLLTKTHYEMVRDTFILDSPHSLRTLIFSGYREVDNKAWKKLLLALKSLRVLRLSDGVRLLELPNSIGFLKHLRFLSLRDQSNIKQLPDSICDLYNMQILILKGCRSLTTLPNDMRKLVNLFLLDIRGTKLQEMPPHMGELTKLQKLSGDFVVGEQKQRGSNSSINELGKLCNLRGSLSIRGLQNVVDAGDAKEANLKGKQHVEELGLEWGDEEDKNNCSLHQEQVLVELVPHKELKILSISGYGGERFVDWVGNSSFSCMESLGLRRCKIRSLPPLWQLACLEKLTIDGCSRITSIGSELYSMKKLKRLKISNLQEWCEWISDGDVHSDTNFPLLQELSVVNCPKLKKALPGHLPSVTGIEIHSCEQLEMEWFQLECFPKLEKLQIWHCPKLVSFCKGRSPNCSSNLASLSLWDCPNLKVLPEYFLWSNLATLGLYDCPEIESFPTTLQLNLGGSNSKLRILTVWGCKKLFSRRHEWGLEMLPSLLSLFIGGGCDEVVEESFPEKTLLPSTLTSLSIGEFPNLKSLNYEGLQHLTSLSFLAISKCPKLQSLLLPNQNQKLPSSLSSLWIYDCPLLLERCEPERGEDWPKIAHIPNIYFDGGRISK